MRPTRYIIAGWATGLAAVAAGCLTLPAIADKASSQRAETVMVNTAMDFRRLSDANLNDHVSSPAIVRLAELFGPDAPVETSMERTAFDLEAIAPQQTIRIRESKANMAQAQCLAEAIYYEARSETTSGQMAVAQVVQNRVRSKHFPNTICGVVYQGAERRTGCQFSFTCDGSTERSPRGKAWTRSQDVAQLVLTQSPSSLVNRSTHYHTTDISPVWSGTLEETRTVGSHVFYRFPWRERRSVAALQTVAPPS